MTCGVCGQPNEAGRKFCGECGSPLALACSACGTSNAPGTKFCGECGSPLGDADVPAARSHGSHTAALGVAAKVDLLPATIHVRALDSQVLRLRVNAAAAAGDADAGADGYAVALASARNLGYVFFLAPVLADYGTWLQSMGRVDEAAPLQEARELFEGMGAVVWLRRLDAFAPAAATTV